MAADALLAAAEVVEQVRPHGGPAQAGAVAHGAVHVLHGGDAAQHEVHGLAPQRGGEAVDEVAGQVAGERDRLLADRCVEGGGALHGLRRREGAGGELHERHQVRRVVGVGGEAALRPARRRLDVADREARRARADEGILRRRRVHGGEDLALELQVLTHALLHVPDAGHRLIEVGRRAQRGAAARRRVGVGEPVAGQEPCRVPRALEGAGESLAVHVVDPHCEAGGREQPGPAGAGQPGADDGHRAARAGHLGRRRSAGHLVLAARPHQCRSLRSLAPILLRDRHGGSARSSRSRACPLLSRGARSSPDAPATGAGHGAC